MTDNCPLDTLPQGHLHAWHMKLRSKSGWAVLEAIEADGRVTAYSPLGDRAITYDQVSSCATRLLECATIPPDHETVLLYHQTAILSY